MGEQERVVKQDIGVLPGGGTGLKTEVDDFFQRLAEPQDQVGCHLHVCEPL
jgi:hypothetical protein